jgi:hypothetical protein
MIARFVRSNRNNDGPPPQKSPPEIAEVSAPSAPEPVEIPPDPGGHPAVTTWRKRITATDPEQVPRGYRRVTDWQRARTALLRFCSSNYAYGNLACAALDQGWTELDLFAVGRTAGVTNLSHCGALLPNSHGAHVTHVRPDRLHFSNGLTAYRRPLDPAECLPIWDYEEKTNKDGASK